MSFLHAAGEPAGSILGLGWLLLAVGCGVVIVVGVLLVLGARRGSHGEIGPVERTGESRGIRWIVVGGILLPAGILALTTVATTVTLAGVTHPDSPAVVTIQVTGHRWWWEARYLGAEPDQAFVTANELHVPVGQAVRLELSSDDVIHSFWVPALAGKTDLIPGQRNQAWLQASRAGVYRGQCAEYCGLQHAHMALVVVAEPPAEFDAWVARQRRPAESTAASAAGEAVFARSACVSCHTIRGTGAMGRVGPDLTHFGSRMTLGSALAPNTRGHLAGWISDAQGMKPGSQMPSLSLPPDDLLALVDYLESLR